MKLVGEAWYDLMEPLSFIEFEREEPPPVPRKVYVNFMEGYIRIDNREYDLGCFMLMARSILGQHLQNVREHAAQRRNP